MKTHDDVDIIQMKKAVIKNASWKHTQTFYGESLLQTNLLDWIRPFILRNIK